MMKGNVHMKTISNIISAALLASFALLPQMRAVVPPPDGGYPNFTTAEGDHALQHLTGGIGNTGIGTFSLFSVSAGNFNTAVGAGSLDLNTADSNTAAGAAALLFNTMGTENTAVGTAALEFNNSGNVNSAFGALALINNTGSNNTAIGDRALLNNIGGGSNTAVGQAAMLNNHTGSSNIAIGVQALGNNNSGSNNIALGNVAGAGLMTGSGNIYIGSVTGSVAGETGHTYIQNIGSTTVSGGGTDTVTVNLTTGLVGHLSSSRRYKEDIKPMDNASEALYRLKPVTYRYKKQIDSGQSPAFGLIAEQVADVNPDLVARNSQGQPESVHYEMVNAMLLNEFLKEHRKVEEHQATITQLKRNFQSKLERQQKQIEALTAGLQKVSAQLEVNKPAPQTVLNNR